MASSPRAALTIVGNRPEPWDDFCDFMKSYQLEVRHEGAPASTDPSHHNRILAFRAPIKEKINKMKDADSFDSFLCEGLFARDSWDLLAQLLKDIAEQDFKSLGELLQNPTHTESVQVKSAKERHDLKDKMVDYLKTQKVRTTITDRCYQVAEEMLMNAIYDAPSDKSGKSLYNHLSRKEDVHLTPEQYSTFEYGTKNQIVAIAVSDPFGGLTRDMLIDYLEANYRGKPDHLNAQTGKGGAGRGLHQIVENSDLTVFQVKKGEKTRVVSYFWQRHNPFGENPQLSFIYFD
ncbi:MAG: hypothetical protein ACK5Y2_10330 [Bdellovibrionales bacterium]